MKAKSILIGATVLLSMGALNAKATWLKFDTRPFRPISSDLKEVKFDYIVLNEKRVNATIGGHYPIFDWDIDGKDRVQVGIFGLGFNRLQIKDGFAFDLNSYDAVFGAYADYKIGPLAFSFRYAHTSTHLSEGYYVSRNEEISVYRYSREHLQLMADYNFKLGFLDMRLIGGFVWVNASVSPVEIRDAKLIGAQVGAEVELPAFSVFQSSEPTCRPFVSFLASTQTETNYFVSKSVAFGLKINGSGVGSFRLMGHYFSGIDPRGNFYTKQTEFWGFGVAYFF